MSVYYKISDKIYDPLPMLIDAKILQAIKINLSDYQRYHWFHHQDKTTIDKKSKLVSLTIIINHIIRYSFQGN